ncbi:hypothetical protein ACM16X_04985 [Haloarcula japonica]|uniref:hypothetical protein n=1 Tax=Haloarcula japonica TaxID=29282 RepID=UPI0039F6B803
MTDDDLTDDALQKGLLTAIIVVLMVPGLVIEPGPVTEVVGVAAIGSVWGLDLTGDDGGGES